MNEEQFNAKLRELIKEIASLPQDKQDALNRLAGETKQRHKAIKESVDNVTKSLSDLRICLKYIMFDLEATRRERDQLQMMLGNDDDDDTPRKAEGEM